MILLAAVLQVPAGVLLRCTAAAAGCVLLVVLLVLLALCFVPGLPCLLVTGWPTEAHLQQ